MTSAQEITATQLTRGGYTACEIAIALGLHHSIVREWLEA